MRRSDGEFLTDNDRAQRIETQNITVENGTATTTFTIAEESKPIELSLVSYKKVGPGWSPETEALQEFVNAETNTFGPGTYTLTVDLPNSETTDTNQSSTTDH
jgi:hypothetical protein